MRRLQLLASVLKDPNRRAFILSSGAHALSDSAFLVALLVAAHSAGGVRAAGLAGVARMAPAAVLAPFAAAFADRYGRRTTLAVSCFLRAAAVSLTAVSFGLGLPLWVGLVAAGLVGVVSAVVRPAQWAMPSDLASGPEEVAPIMVGWSTLEGAGTIAGPAVAGVLFGTLGGPAAMAFAAVGAAAAGVFAWMMRVAERKANTSSAAWSDLKEGLRVAAVEPRPRLLLGLFLGQTFTRGMLNVLIVVAAVGLLGLGKSGAGYMTAGLGVGGLLGGFVAIAFVGSRRLGGRFAFSLFIWGAPIAVIGLVPNPLLALGMIALVGLGNTLLDVSGITLLQRVAPPHALSRVFGVLEGLVFLGGTFGSVAAAELVEAAGVRSAHVIAAMLLPVLALVALPALRNIDRQVQVPRQRLMLIGNSELFSYLPDNILTTLAIRMLEVGFGEGDVVVTQGEPGGSVYVVAEGTLEVVRDDRTVARLGPGDYFGEISLVEEIPRIATVVAASDARLLVLDRSDFLHTVVGDPASARSLAEVVRARMQAS